MHFSTLSSLIPLLFAALRVVQAQDDGCPPGTTSVENPPGTGNIQCVTVVYTCPGGDDRAYVDAASNANLCCPPAQDIRIYDPKTRVGACCGPNENYAGIAPNGKCCPKGQILGSDGKCTIPPPSCCGSNGSSGCPTQPNGVCRLQLACGDATTTNGLKYGSCYQMMFPNSDGKQLGRQPDTYPDGPVYVQEGHIQNIFYKICKSTADGQCGTGPVKPTDTFYISDQVGLSDDKNGVPAWVGNAAVQTAIAITSTPASAAQFKGTTGCSGCACVVSLTGAGKGLGTWESTDQPGILKIAFWANPAAALDMQFAEIPCDGNFGFPTQQ